MKRIRLLGAVAALGVAGSMFGMAAATAPAANAANSFELANAHSAKCLGVSGGRHDAPAVQWSCDGNPDQAWHWGGADVAGFHQLVNGDGQCLGISGASLNLGARVVAWNCLGTSHTDQYWQIDGTIALPPDDEYYSQHSLLDITVSGRSTANGAAIVQEPSNGLPSWLWHAIG